MPTLPAELVRCYPEILDGGASTTAVSGGFSGARVWKVEAGGLSFAVRKWPDAGLSNERILGLHHLLHHLRACGLNTIAVPTPSRDSATLVTIQGTRWQVEPWLNGSPAAAEPGRVKLTNAISALSEWHAAASTFAPAPTSRQWFGSGTNQPSPAVGERLRMTRQWRERDLVIVQTRLTDESEFTRTAYRICQLAAEALPIIERELIAASPLQFNLQPCLRDVWREHVLFEGDAVSGIIDPSACRTENIATDIARLVGSLVGDHADSWQFAIDAYNTWRPLSLDEQRLVRTLDRSAVVLSPLTWLKRRYLANTPFDETAVATRLREQEQRLTVLLQ